MHVNVMVNRPTIKGWELRKGIESFAKSLAGRVAAAGKHPVSINWIDIGTAAIDQWGRIYLSSIDDSATVTRPVFVRYVGFVLHEVLHYVYTNFASRGSNAWEQTMHNAVEDAWIESNGIASGLTGNIEGVLRAVIGEMVRDSIAKRSDWTDPACYPWVFAVMLRPHAPTVPVAKGLMPIIVEARRRLATAACSADTLTIARWIITQLQGLPQDGQPPKQPPKQPPQQPGQDGEQDGQDGEQPGQEQDGEQPGENVSAGAARRIGNETPENPEITAPESPAPGITVYPSAIAAPGIHLHDTRSRPLTVTVPAALRYEIRRIFDSTGRTLFHPGRRSGSLNARALHRTDDRLFQRREDIDGIDSAVMLAIDASGSMATRMNPTCSAAWALWDALTSAGVKVGACSFDGATSSLWPIGAARPAVRSALERLMPCGGTDDATALQFALDCLLVRPEARRVIFILSDGDGRPKAAAKICESAQRLGVTVIGVGIEHDVSHVYPNAVRVDDVADLGRSMFKQIKVAA
jgi:Mg-chelatase subunit ChlD